MCSCVEFFVILWTVALQPSLPMGFPRQEYWSDCLFHLQEIFLIQGLNPCLLHYASCFYYFFSYYLTCQSCCLLSKTGLISQLCFSLRETGKAWAQAKVEECLVSTQALHGALWAPGSGGFLQGDEYLSTQSPFHPISLFLGQDGGQALVVAPLTVPCSRMTSCRSHVYGTGLAEKPTSRDPGLLTSFLLVGCHWRGVYPSYLCWHLCVMATSEEY